MHAIKINYIKLNKSVGCSFIVKVCIVNCISSKTNNGAGWNVSDNEISHAHAYTCVLFENKSAIAAMVLNYIHAGIALSGGKN